jgi:hypothetical protein
MFLSTEIIGVDKILASTKFSRWHKSKVLILSHVVAKCGIASGRPGLWADSLLYCTGLLYRPAMQKTSQILAPRFHWFSPNYSSLFICSQASCKKLVKTKSDHHHCPIAVRILMTSKLEAVIEIHHWDLWLLKWGVGGKRGGTPCCTSFHLSGK